MSDVDRAVATVREVVSLLVQGDFDVVERRSSGIRLTASDMKRAIEEYGRRLIMPPTEAFEDLDVLEIEHAHPLRWSVRFNLWTAEEGKSDLSLELTLLKKNGTPWDVEVDDIHVL